MDVTSSQPDPMSGPIEHIFQIVPDEDSPALLLLILFVGMCLGAVVIELLNHAWFDIELIRKPGWTQPMKCISRLAYFLCRYLSAVCLMLVLLYVTAGYPDCSAAALAFNILGMFFWNSVALLFVLRTMALYSWKRAVVVPLVIYYAIVATVSAISLPFYGVGKRVPQTQFCSYDTKSHAVQHLIAGSVYQGLGMGLDLTLLLLTLHRLLDGGLMSIFTRKTSRLNSGLTSLTSFLIYQGFHFYVFQFGTDAFYLTSTFAFTKEYYQLIGNIMEYTIPSIVASAAFRDMGKRAQEFNRHGVQVNEIFDSSGILSQGRSSSGKSGISPIPRVSDNLYLHTHALGR